jgi:hypothetical protein
VITQLSSHDQLLKSIRYVAYFIYVLALLAVIYATVRTILHANYGSAVANDAIKIFDKYQEEIKSHPGNATPDVTQQIRNLRIEVLTKSCTVVRWTGSLPPFLKLVGSVAEDNDLHLQLCKYERFTRMTVGTLPVCKPEDKDRNDKSACFDLNSEMKPFENIAPGGDTSQFAADVRAQTNALLQQMQTILLPFLFGVIGGFLALFFDPRPGSVQIANPEAEAMRYLVRPAIGGVAGLLVCLLFAGGTRVEQSYSINMLGLLAGYGLELLPMALNRGLRTVRDVLEKDSRGQEKPTPPAPTPPRPEPGPPESPLEPPKAKPNPE